MVIKLTYEKGFTLVEVLAVLVIVVIISSIAVPAVFGVMERAREGACEDSRLLIEKDYERELSLEGLDHSDALFNERLMEFVDPCPEGGFGEEDDGGVPFL